MTLPRWLRWTAAALLLGGILAAAFKLAFVPSPREPAYRLVAAWGRPGSGPGQFNQPTGIAVSGDRVFVSDARNGRIQVFDRSGRFRYQFGRSSDDTALGRPMNLTVAGDELYVADYWTSRVAVYGLDGTLHRLIGREGRGPGAFNSPGGVAVAGDGTLYVADFYNQRVQHLAADGRFLGQWGTTGEVGSGPGEFNYPTDVAIAAAGALVVADGYNDRIQVFAPDGRLLRKWGGPFAANIHGPFNGWFATVTSVAVGPAGAVFAADFYHDRVQKFSADGTFLTAFGTPVDGPAHGAIAVDVADDGTVYVASFGADQVEVWRPAAVPPGER